MLTLVSWHIYLVPLIKQQRQQALAVFASIAPFLVVIKLQPPPVPLSGLTAACRTHWNLHILHLMCCQVVSGKTFSWVWGKINVFNNSWCFFFMNMANCFALSCKKYRQKTESARLLQSDSHYFCKFIPYELLLCFFMMQISCIYAGSNICV